MSLQTWKMSKRHGRNAMKQFYTPTLDNLDDMGQLLGKHRLLQLPQQEIDNLNSHITLKEMKFVI